MSASVGLRGFCRSSSVGRPRRISRSSASPTPFAAAVAAATFASRAIAASAAISSSERPRPPSTAGGALSASPSSRLSPSPSGPPRERIASEGELRHVESVSAPSRSMSHHRPLRHSGCTPQCAAIDSACMQPEARDASMRMHRWPKAWRAAAAPDHRDVSRSVANTSTSRPAVFTTGLPSRSRHHSSSMRNRPSSAASPDQPAGDMSERRKWRWPGSVLAHGSVRSVQESSASRARDHICAIVFRQRFTAGLRHVTLFTVGPHQATSSDGRRPRPRWPEIAN